MKLLIYICLITVLTHSFNLNAGIISTADLPIKKRSTTSDKTLESPQELLNTASKSSSDLINAVLRLKDNIKQLRTPDEFNKYFHLLDDFSLLSTKFNLALVYPDLVSSLGTSMVLHGVRWFHVANTPTSLLESYLKWSNAMVANKILSFCETQVPELNNNERAAQNNLQTLESWSSNNLQDQVYITHGFQRVLTDLSLKVLKTTKLSNHSELSYWLESINSENGLQEYIYFLNTKLLNEGVKDQSEQWQNHVFLVGEISNKNKQLRQSTQVNYGVLVADLYTKVIESQKTINTETFKQQIQILQPVSIKGLVYRWIGAKNLNDNYKQQLVVPSTLLKQQLKKLGLKDSLKELNRFIAEVLVPSIITDTPIEGTYALKDKDGNRWNLTMVKESEKRLIASISNEAQSVGLSYFYVEYDFETQTYKAMESYPDNNDYKTPAVSINFQPDSSVVVKLPPSLSLNHMLIGEKFESYLKPNSNKSSHKKIIGDYTGTLQLKSGRIQKYKLSIMTFEDSTYAYLSTDSGNIKINFNKGSLGDNGFIYLTTGKNLRGTWTHLRLQQDSNEELSGEMISGGVGVIGRFLLKKVE